MARDPLQILSMLRRHAVEQARQTLAICAQAEAQVIDRIKMLDEAAACERAAGMTDHDYQFLEMSVRRQQALKAERQFSETSLAAAASRSAEARQHVVAARTNAEAVTTLIEEHAAVDEAEANRRAQHALDDMARRPRHPAGRQLIRSRHKA